MIDVERIKKIARRAARRRGGNWHRHIHPAQNTIGCLCHEAAADAVSEVWVRELRRAGVLQ